MVKVAVARIITRTHVCHLGCLEFVPSGVSGVFFQSSHCI